MERDEISEVVARIGRAVDQAIRSWLRVHEDRTIEEFVSRVGVNRSTIWSLRSSAKDGKGRLPETATLIAIARECGVMPGRLLDGEVVPVPGPIEGSEEPAIAKQVLEVITRQFHEIKVSIETLQSEVSRLRSERP